MDFTRSQSRTIFVVIALLVAWWAAACFITIQIKTLLNESFGTAFALTAHTNMSSALFMWLFLAMKALKTKKFNSFSYSAWRFVALVGVCQGIEYGLLNQALHDVTLSTRTMIMSSSAMYTFATAQCWGIPPKLTWPRCGCMVVLLIGGAFQAWVASDEATGNPVRGILCMVVALTCSAQRWAYAQKVFQSSNSPVADYNKLEISARLLPFASLPCYVVSAAVETVPAISGRIVERILVVSLGIIVLTCCELKLVHLTSSTTFVIFALLHNIPLFFCGVIFFHDDVAAPQLVGFLITVAGSLWYAWITDLTETSRSSEREALVDADGNPPPSAPPLPDAGSVSSDIVPVPSAPPMVESHAPSAPPTDWPYQ